MQCSPHTPLRLLFHVKLEKIYYFWIFTLCRLIPNSSSSTKKKFIYEGTTAKKFVLCDMISKGKEQQQQKNANIAAKIKTLAVNIHACVSQVQNSHECKKLKLKYGRSRKVLQKWYHFMYAIHRWKKTFTTHSHTNLKCDYG